MTSSFVPGVSPPTPRLKTEGCFFVFRGSQLLVRSDAEGARLPFASELGGEPPEGAAYLGQLGGQPCLTWEAGEQAPLPEGLLFLDLRRLYDRLPGDAWAAAGRGVQILTFLRTHRHCGQCGGLTQQVAGERSLRCEVCKLTVYPRISPAVIVLVERGDEALLGRGVNFPEAFYSTLAGFVEAGESLEETIHREIREEAGVSVTNLRYFSSQPWPFPHSLMVGFRADYAGGEIRVEPTELVDARWFRFDALPKVPPRGSIARQLIDDWVASRRALAAGLGAARAPWRRGSAPPGRRLRRRLAPLRKRSVGPSPQRL